jgi:hypothetical protein
MDRNCTQDERSLTRWRNSIIAAFALGGITVSTWGPRLPAIRSELRAGAGMIGLVPACATVGSISGLLWARTRLQRLGGRRAISSSLLAVAARLGVMARGESACTRRRCSRLASPSSRSVSSPSISASTSTAPRSSAKAGRTLLPLISDTFELRLSAATSQGEAVDAIVSRIHSDRQRSPREQVLTYELYTLAVRRGELGTTSQGWMQSSRRALPRHFAPDTARALDASIEGAALDIALNPDPQSATQTRDAITRPIAPSDDQGGAREQDR